MCVIKQNPLYIFNKLCHGWLILHDQKVWLDRIFMIDFHVSLYDESTLGSIVICQAYDKVFYLIDDLI